MARYTGPKCKLSPVVRHRSFVKSARRSLDSKCKLAAAPGQHGAKVGQRMSNYWPATARKQAASKSTASSNVSSVARLPKRHAARARRARTCSLLNRVLTTSSTAWLGSTRAEARQLVSHKAILVDGKMCNIPSAIIAPNAVISVCDKSKAQARIIDAVALAERIGFPAGLT